jgi:hypothetical protein
VYCDHVVGGNRGNGRVVLVFLNERGGVVDPIPRPAPKAASVFI